MPDGAFLETYPLYRKFPYIVPKQASEIAQPPVHMECVVCGNGQTFRMQHQWYDDRAVKHRFDWLMRQRAPIGSGIHCTSPNGLTLTAVYNCAACGNSLRLFVVHFDADGQYIMKAGQFPTWDISIATEVKKAMGTFAEHYKQGKICESQGFGIGAFAYYRRVVEGIIDNLLDSIPAIMEDDDKKAFADALAKSKAETQASRKIELIRDLIPACLRPQGINPLYVLHDTLSEGVHTLDEDECLRRAANIRESLEFFITQVNSVRYASKQFTEHMRKQLDRRTSQGQGTSTPLGKTTRP